MQRVATAISSDSKANQRTPGPQAPRRHSQRSAGRSRSNRLRGRGRCSRPRRPPPAWPRPARRSPAATALGPPLGRLHRQLPQAVRTGAVRLRSRGSRRRRCAALPPLLLLRRLRPRGPTRLLDGVPGCSRLFLRLHGRRSGPLIPWRPRCRRGAPHAGETDARPTAPRTHATYGGRVSKAGLEAPPRSGEGKSWLVSTQRDLSPRTRKRSRGSLGEHMRLGNPPWDR